MMPNGQGFKSIAMAFGFTVIHIYPKIFGRFLVHVHRSDGLSYDGLIYLIFLPIRRRLKEM